MSNAFRFNGVSRLNAGVVEQGSPGSITGLTELKLYGIEFYDEEGRAKKMVVMQMNDGNFCIPPNAMEWAMSLRAAPEWLVEKMKSVVVDKGAPVVTDNSVDVLPP